MNEKYLDYAETALAAYGVGFIFQGDNTLKYVESDMSAAEAHRFNDKWAVLSQSSDHSSGFSAVLLQNRESGEKVLAIRGSESVADYITDIVDIAGLGTVAKMQQNIALEAYYASLVSSGKLTAAEQIVVTGHSLGGFLAQAFTARHDDVVSAAYTFNAPGFGGAMTQVLEFLGMTDAWAPNGKITNVRAADGASATAGLGQVLGSMQEVRIEAGSANPVYYHSIATLTDTLSVYQAYAGLQPWLSIEQMGQFLSGAGIGGRKLEDALDALRVAILGPGAHASKTITGDKESLFNNLYAFTNSDAYKNLVGQLTIEAATPALQSQARYDFAALVALQDLSPIAVRGVPASLWQSSRAEDDLLDGDAGSDGDALLSGAINACWISARGQIGQKTSTGAAWLA